MSREAMVELAWANFIESEKNFNAYLFSTGCDLARQKELTEAVKEAMDEVLD